RLRAHDPVDGKAVPALEADDRRLGQRTSDSVDRGGIETQSLQCDLDCRDLGAGGGWGGKDQQTSNCQCDSTGNDPVGQHASMLGTTPDGRNSCTGSCELKGTVPLGSR